MKKTANCARVNSVARMNSTARYCSARPRSAAVCCVAARVRRGFARDLARPCSGGGDLARDREFGRLNGAVWGCFLARARHGEAPSCCYMLLCCSRKVCYCCCLFVSFPSAIVWSRRDEMYEMVRMVAHNFVSLIAFLHFCALHASFQFQASCFLALLLSISMNAHFFLFHACNSFSFFNFLRVPFSPFHFISTVQHLQEFMSTSFVLYFIISHF